MNYKQTNTLYRWTLKVLMAIGAAILINGCSTKTPAPESEEVVLVEVAYVG